MRMTVAAMLFMNADITPTMSHQQRQAQPQAAAKPRDDGGDRGGHAGLHETRAEHEHGRHRDHGGAAESTEHPIRRYQPGKGHGEQRQDAHQVRTYALAGEEHQGAAQHADQYPAVGCHRAFAVMPRTGNGIG